MWLFTAVVVLLIGAVAVVASGRWGGMADAYDDRPDLRVPSDRPLSADDIETSRFAVVVRGYRMDEVDSLLERLAREVAVRDGRIADLERAVRPILEAPSGDGFEADAEENPTPSDTGVVHTPVGRHAARRAATDPETAPVPDDATQTPESPETTEPAEPAEPAATAATAATAEPPEADEATEPADHATGPETASEEAPQQPMPVVIPRLRDPEPEPEVSKVTDTDQPERPAPVIPRLRDPDPQTTDPANAQSSPSEPPVPEASADELPADRGGERRSWTVHGAPSQVVKPAPKRTDEAVRPAPKPAQPGPRAVPRSVPQAVEDPEHGQAAVEQNQSPAERRA